MNDVFDEVIYRLSKAWKGVWWGDYSVCRKDELLSFSAGLNVLMDGRQTEWGREWPGKQPWGRGTIEYSSETIRNSLATSLSAERRRINKDTIFGRPLANSETRMAINWRRTQMEVFSFNKFEHQKSVSKIILNIIWFRTMPERTFREEKKYKILIYIPSPIQDHNRWLQSVASGRKKNTWNVYFLERQSLSLLPFLSFRPFCTMSWMFSGNSGK